MEFIFIIELVKSTTACLIESSAVAAHYFHFGESNVMQYRPSTETMVSYFLYLSPTPEDTKSDTTWIF